MRISAEEIGADSIDELRERTPAELKENLQTLRRLSVDLQFQTVYGQVENTRRLGDARRNTARVLTILREKQIQSFLMSDPDVQEGLNEGRYHLSAGKQDPKSAVGIDDISGNDARSVTLAMRLWASLRKEPSFFERTRQLPRV